jgi:glutathione S-transferase
MHSYLASAAAEVSTSDFAPGHSMMRLIHHPFCPRSRYVRLHLFESGIEVELFEEQIWHRRKEFLVLNPAATTPVLIADGFPSVPGATVIAEFVDETCGSSMGQRRLLPTQTNARIEVRRLAEWFNDKFCYEVSGPFATERIFKRLIPAAKGGGTPDGSALRAAGVNLVYHLDYIRWLLRREDWLAGERMSLADLAAAAHLSIVDYLGQLSWNAEDRAKDWYMRVKCRPSFRAILQHTCPDYLHPARTCNLTKSRFRKS